MFINSFSSVYLFISEADDLMPTSDDQQAQIAELKADFRVLQEKFITHESTTETQLTKYKNWILGGGSTFVTTFLALAIAIIVSLALDIF